MLEDVIYQAINENLPCSFLDVTGDGRHFEAVVVSESFVNQSLKLYTPEEWSKLNG